MAAIILDTCIISNAYLPEPPEWLTEWMRSLPPESVIVPWTTIYETEYGIKYGQRHNPVKSAWVLGWFEEFLETRMIILDMNVRAARILGQMAACPPLRNMFETPSRTNRKGERIKGDKIRIGVDAMVAAMSIAHGIPVASMNTKDFLHINRYFAIPGLYDPRWDRWAIDPPLSWMLSHRANDDDPSIENSPSGNRRAIAR